MKILHVVGWLAPRYGGTVSVVTELVPRSARRGHEVEVITTNVDGPGVLPVSTNTPIEWAGFTATFHSVNPPRRYLTSWSMLGALRERIAEFDVVHIHSLYRFHTVAAGLIAGRREVPYVLQAHGALDPWNRRRRRRAKAVYHALIEDRIINGAAALLCTSAQEESGILELDLDVPTHVIPLGIDTAALQAAASFGTIPALASLPVGKPIVVFLGRVSAVKGLDRLLVAFRDVVREFPDARLVVAGPDDEGIIPRFASMTAAWGLSERVLFVGVLAHPAKRALLQTASVLVLPSAGESFGLAAAEAMAVGCPVVVSSRVGIQDTVVNSGAGIVTSREPADIARAVATVLGDPAGAAAMGEAGIRAVEAQFSWPQVIEKLEALYESVRM